MQPRSELQRRTTTRPDRYKSMELSVTERDATNLLPCGRVQQLSNVENHRIDGEGVHEQTVHGMEHLCYDNNKKVAGNAVSQPQGLLSAHRNSGELKKK